MDADRLTECSIMIDDCFATKRREEKLTEWEHEFLQSLEEQVASRRSLSEKQIAVLERVWEKVTDQG